MKARQLIVAIDQGTTGTRDLVLDPYFSATKLQWLLEHLQATAYQTRDVVEAMAKATGEPLEILRADGGAASNDFLMQFQADILGVEVERPKIIETTALGAAYLAGLGVGFWGSTEEVKRLRKVDRRFRPRLKISEREALYEGWKEAVSLVRTSGGMSALAES